MLNLRRLIFNSFIGLLITYTILITIELIKPGFVTLYINIYYLVYTLIIFGVTSLWIHYQVGKVKDITSAIFIASVLLLAINNVLYLNVLRLYGYHLLLLAVLSGLIILWSNRDELNIFREVISHKREKNGVSKEYEGEWRIIKLRSFIERMNETGWFYTIILLAILSLGAIYLWHITATRWVGTDEGRLLYDAALILQGKLPIQDFIGRAPLLIYVMALIQKLFGVSIVIGRLIFLISVLVSALLIYLIGKEIHSRKTGLIASIIFIFYPWIQEFVTVQTQSFQLVWVLLFIYCLIRGIRSNSGLSLLVAGLCLGLSYSVRESGAIFIITLPVLLFIYSNSFKVSLKQFIYVLIPFTIMVIIPTFTIGSGIAGVSGLITTGHEYGGFSLMYERLVGGLPLIYFFLLFTLPLITYLIIDIIRKKFAKSSTLENTMELAPNVLVYWFGSLLLFYLGYAVIKKFHFQYFREFLPMFTLMTAIATSFFAKLVFKIYPRILKFISILLFFGIVYASFFVSANNHMSSERPRYTLTAISEVSAFIKTNTSPSDFIFCGSPIWSYMSERNNAGYLSHIISYVDPEMLKSIEATFLEGQVKYIILDGYTEKLINESAYLREIIEIDFKLVKEVKEGSWWNIRILEINSL